MGVRKFLCCCILILLAIIISANAHAINGFGYGKPHVGRKLLGESQGRRSISPPSPQANRGDDPDYPSEQP